MWLLKSSKLSEKIILHKNIQLQAEILGKRLNLEKMSKISHISETHALIQVREKPQTVRWMRPTLVNYFLVQRLKLLRFSYETSVSRNRSKPLSQ